MSRTDRPSSETCRATALVYRVVSAGFRYPDSANLDAFTELAAGMSQAVACLDDRDSELARSWRELERQAAAAPAERENEHVSLFGHAVHGPCPPYEAEYGERGERLQQPHELADLAAFYRAFGLDVAADERPDYLPIECEFAAFLCLKHAYAADSGDGALLRVAREARARFLREHLGRWTPTFIGLLVRESEAGFHAALARILGHLVSVDRAGLGVARARDTLTLRPPAEAPETFLQCPMSAGDAPAMEV